MKIVLSGATHSGKTTLLNEFEKRGYRVVPEVAIEVISDLNKKYGVKGSRQWRAHNFDEHELKICHRQIEREKQAGSDQLVFIDRGLIDNIAYYYLFERSIPKEVVDLAKKQAVTYDYVVIPDIILPFDDRFETGRLETEEMAIKMRNLHIKAYKDYGFSPILVKQMPVSERANFIIDQILPTHQ